MVAFLLICHVASGEVCGYYSGKFGQNSFCLVLSEGKFHMQIQPLDEKKRIMRMTNPMGNFFVRNDTLILLDTVFQNQYHYLIIDSSLYPIRPNYSFLLEKPAVLNKTVAPDYYQLKPFRSNPGNNAPVFNAKRYYEIDTVSAFSPANEYTISDYASVHFCDSIVAVKIFGLTIFWGTYKILRGRVIFFSEDMNGEFEIFQGTKSYGDVVMKSDPLVRNSSFPKKYTSSEWEEIIKTAKEFKLGGDGVGPKFIKSD